MKKRYFIASIALLTFCSGIGSTDGQLVVFNPHNLSSNPSVTNLVYKWRRTPVLSWNTSEWKAYFYNGTLFRVIFPPEYLTSLITKIFPCSFFSWAVKKGSIITKALPDYYFATVNPAGNIKQCNFNMKLWKKVQK